MTWCALSGPSWEGESGTPRVHDIQSGGAEGLAVPDLWHSVPESWRTRDAPSLEETQVGHLGQGT